MLWKELLKLFTTIYGKIIYKAINTPKISFENRVPTLNSRCFLGVKCLKCAYCSLDQLKGARSCNP